MVIAEDVRAALRMVAGGQAPLAIVYETDAKIEPAVKVIGVFPDNTENPIIYPVALRANAKPDAVRYFSFLQTRTAKSVFEKYSFNFLVRPTS
jgi:molybdate transport system substrate-binding protein